jgi:hypothetical protein
MTIINLTNKFFSQIERIAQIHKGFHLRTPFLMETRYLDVDGVSCFCAFMISLLILLGPCEEFLGHRGSIIQAEAK